jgi:hypothetical protein
MEATGADENKSAFSCRQNFKRMLESMANDQKNSQQMVIINFKKI